MPSVSIEWDKNALKKIQQAPDKILYHVARLTLDISYPHIPLSNKVNSGRLRSSSMSGEVKKDSQGYYIGSYTSYAKYVWVMGRGTNWSTPGTFGKWYEQSLKQSGKTIISEAVRREYLK